MGADESGWSSPPSPGRHVATCQPLGTGGSRLWALVHSHFPLILGFPGSGRSILSPDRPSSSLGGIGSPRDGRTRMTSPFLRVGIPRLRKAWNLPKVTQNARDTVWESLESTGTKRSLTLCLNLPSGWCSSEPCFQGHSDLQRWHLPYFCLCGLGAHAYLERQMWD